MLAHDTAVDPRFVCANGFAQRCFELEGSEIIGMPSRLSAEAAARDERAAASMTVTTQGYVADYRGVRIAKSGRRFWIEHGMLWNVRDPEGVRIGQAATFAKSRPA